MEKISIKINQEDIKNRLFREDNKYKKWNFEPMVKDYLIFKNHLPQWYLEEVFKDYIIGYFWIRKYDYGLTTFKNLSKIEGRYLFKLNSLTNKYETAKVKIIAEEKFLKYINWLKKGL